MRVFCPTFYVDDGTFRSDTIWEMTTRLRLHK